MAQGSESIFTAVQKRQIAAQLRALRAVDYIRQTRPVWGIEALSEGQLAALASGHTYRILIPGNGFGKTFCQGVDLDLLMQRDDPFKPTLMPGHPPTAIWCCQKYQQWEIMRPAIERNIFSAGWKWNDQKHCYSWPNGSRCFLLSSDSDWTAIQGIEPDAVYFDEHPDRQLWVEMQYRRRGRAKTRYMVAATMTQGLTWFVRDQIQPWEQYHRDRGLTNDQALTAQEHPTTFIWNVGGIRDNPIMSAADEAHYASITAASEKERQVRLSGGYADFTGESVFDGLALEHMEAAAVAGESGGFVFVPDEDHPDAAKLKTRLMRTSDGEPMGHRFNGADDRLFFRWVPDLPVERGRITIYEQPLEGERDNYIIGADFAAGLIGKDYDAAIVGRKTADGQLLQVAEAAGHWGDVFFAEILYFLAVWYYGAFIVGERQFGLPCLRRLYDEMGYTYLYHQRREDSRARRPSDLLGHHRAAGDTIIPNARLAVKREEVRFVSRDTLTQLKRYQFRPRNKTQTIDDVEASTGLVTGAPSGENDDLVMAGAYLVHGAREIVHFVRPKPLYKPGSFGDVFKLQETLNPKRKARDPYALR